MGIIASKKLPYNFSSINHAPGWDATIVHCGVKSPFNNGLIVSIYSL